MLNVSDLEGNTPLQGERNKADELSWHRMPRLSAWPTGRAGKWGCYVGCCHDLLELRHRLSTNAPNETNIEKSTKRYVR